MSTIRRAFRTELDLNDRHITACRQHAGAARWAYIWGLRPRQEVYRETGKSLSAIELHRELNALKHAEVPGTYAVSKCAPQEALRNLDRAFDNFFGRIQLKKDGNYRGKRECSERKSKKRGLGSFRLTGINATFPESLQLPRLGPLRLKERGHLPFSGVDIPSATVAAQSGRWYVSVQVAQESVPPANPGPVVGIDLGIDRLATLSGGEAVEHPRHLRWHVNKLKRLYRTGSRKVKGSQNRKKSARRLGNQYRKVANLRANTLDHLTSRLANTKAVVVIDDLNVSGMLKNHRPALASSDAGWGEFRRQLEYKAAWYGGRVILAHRWFTSSKTCCRCGRVEEDLTLAVRVFRCQNPTCMLVMDRDLNAAINLGKLVGSSPESQNACRGRSSGGELRPAVQLSPMKQEPNMFSAPA